ncbi:MAG: TrkH family potassium uptake protein [Bacteroidales bacterium]|nr:TrkH family potassium uptake protein [Bacteroidales bacterium]
MIANRGLALYIIGFLLIVEGVFMLMPGLMSLTYGDSDSSVFFLSAAATMVCGALMFFLFRNHPKDVSKRDSYIIVTGVWISFTIFGTIPVWLSGALPLVDAWFETMSGFSTTGSTMLRDIEASSHGLLFWRAILQWMGGMGIIALSIVLVPALGMSSMQTFTAEASVTRSDKIHPKVTEMAKYMWYIYIAMTFIVIILFIFGGMNVFDASCHALSTVSTGGFSTHTDSIGTFHSAYIEYVTIIFMFLGGVNYALYYSIMVGKGERLINDDEFRSYTKITAIFAIIISLVLYFDGYSNSFEMSFRSSLFQVVSVITGTGFTTCDYMKWPVQTITIIAFIMFCGGCTGSTTGGIKFMRLRIMYLNIKNELKRAMHPTAVVPVKYNNKSLMPADTSSVLTFIVFYVMILAIGILIISMTGCTLEDSFGLAANSLGNVGISIGNYGPSGCIYELHPIAKITMSILMLVGRLEIFTVILLFMPSFWKR